MDLLLQQQEQQQQQSIDYSVLLCRNIDIVHKKNDQEGLALEVNYRPRKDDVICGRGYIINAHNGNKFFRELVAQRLDEYLSYSVRADKTRVIQLIVNVIRRNGGRFLRQDQVTKQWIDIGEKNARKKVRLALRDANADRRRRQRTNNRGRAPQVQRPILERDSSVSSSSTESTPDLEDPASASDEWIDLEPLIVDDPNDIPVAADLSQVLLTLGSESPFSSSSLSSQEQ